MSVHNTDKWMKDTRMTTMVREFHVFSKDVAPREDIMESAPCQVLSWDIETKPVQGDGGAFTQFYKGIDPGGQCITIGCASSQMGYVGNNSNYLRINSEL